MLQLWGGPEEARNSPPMSPWAHWLSTRLNFDGICSKFTHALPIESPTRSDKSRFRQNQDKMSLKPSQISHSRLNESVPCRQSLWWWSWLPWTGQMSGKSCSCVIWKFSLSFFSPKSSYTGWQENRKHYQTLLESQQVGDVSQHSLILIEYHWLNRLDFQYPFCSRVGDLKKICSLSPTKLDISRIPVDFNTYWDGIEMKRLIVHHIHITGIESALLHGLKM
jgi:hypothetical protein